MFEVGFYKTFEHTQGVVVPLPRLLEAIKTGKWKEQVERYRETRDSSIKESLPCYTVSGVFRGTKSIKNLVKKTYLLSLDIDDFEGSHGDLISYFERGDLRKYLYHVSKSCGEGGYCVLIKIKEFEDYEQYKAIYHSVYTELEETGLNKVSKFDYLQNLNRLRFVSYDPDAITFDITTLADYYKELDPPNKVEIKEEEKVVKTFMVGNELSDHEKFDVILERYVEHSGDFGQKGTRHDWILGLGRWACRGGVDESFVVNYALNHFQNPSRPTVWAKEVRKAIKDSYKSYSAEKGTYEPRKKFSYKDILSADNSEEVKTQIYLAIADKLNYLETLKKEKKETKFVESQVLFLKKIVEYIN